MITLDTQGVEQSVIGGEHGLDLGEFYLANQGLAQSAVEHLWNNYQASDSWRGWLGLPEDTELMTKIDQYAQSVKRQFEHLVIVGIGGSALGPLAMFEALLPSYWNERTAEQRKSFPKYYFVDNVDPDKLNALFEVLDLKKTLVNVITKSGTTAETMAGFMWLKAQLEKTVGADQVSRHLVITTDPEKGILRKMVQQENLQAFAVPGNVGGRFSVFSAVGLLPAALLGISIPELCRGLKDLTKELQSPKIEDNIALQGALVQYAAYQQGKRISVFMPYSAKLASVADWYVQLWAESLGKKYDLNQNVVHQGATPLKAVGVTDQHSQVQLFNEGPFDKVTTFIRVGRFNSSLEIPNLYANEPELSYLGNQSFETLLQAEANATRASLTKNQRLNVTLTLPQLDAYHFAQLLLLMEVQTAFMGTFLNVDPFDQPGVELGKQYTHALMGRPGFEHLKDEAMGKVVQPA